MIRLFEIQIKSSGRDTVNDNLNVGLISKSIAEPGNRNCLILKKNNPFVNPLSLPFSVH